MKILFFLFAINLSAKTLPSFSLPDYQTGKVVSLPKQKTVINFWASWCTSCIQELPELHALKEKNPNAIFIAINSGEKKKKIKKFLKRHKFNYMILEDPTKSVAGQYGIESLPRTLVIKKNKKISFSGDRPPKSL